jgi:predicted PolB exonuclease-like 3'-5' exonuclease
VNFIVFDIESIPNPAFIGATQEEQLSWFGKHREEGDDPGTRPWVPTLQQLPWITGILAYREDGGFSEAILEGDEAVKILSYQWTMVGFNSRSFDVPLLEATAHRTSTILPWWFSGSKSWEQPRNRYAGYHHDCMDHATNYGALGRRDIKGGMDTIAKLCGAPGKIDSKGDDVWQMYWDGDAESAKRYVMHDVYNTFLIYLRQMLVAGKWNQPTHDRILKQFRDFLGEGDDLFSDNVHRDEFLEAWDGVAA